MRFGAGSVAGPFQITPWVKRLLLANAIVFVLSVAVPAIAELLAFSPGRLATRPWGLVTYMFVHGGVFHLLFNLLFIFFFGPPLESRWGSDVFIKFYLVCGLGGALLSFAFSGASIIGASAACYGIMLAFAMIWPNAPVWIWGLVPVKVKWLVIFLVTLSLASSIGPARDGVAHLAHLGGAVAGFLLVISGILPQYGQVGTVGAGWQRAAGGGASQGSGWRSGMRPSPRPGRGASAGQRARTAWRWKRQWGGLSAMFIRRRGPGAGPSAPRETRPPASRTQRKARRSERTELDQVDAVLDKISAHGIESLTVEERDLLDRVSRRTRAN